MPEYGPYEQPGWPSSLPYFKPAETFRNAFAITSEINRRKQQLENQMMAMSLRAQQSEIANQIKVAEFQRKLDQGDQRLALAEQGMNLRALVDQHRFDIQGEKLDQAAKIVKETGEFSQYVDETGVSHDDPAFPATLRHAKMLFPNAKVDVEKMLDTFNTRRNDREAKSAADEKLILTEAQRDLFHGKPVDTGVFFDADRRTYRAYETEQSDEEKKQGVPSIPMPAGATKRIDAATGQPTPVVYKKVNGDMVASKSRSVFFPASGPNETVPTFIPVTQGDLKRYQDRLKKVYDERKAIPPLEAVQTSARKPIPIFTREEYDKLPPGQPFIWNPTGEVGAK